MARNSVSKANLNRVVVLENNDATRAAIKSSLAALGFKAHFVRTGPEAIELAEKHKAKHFILDIHLGSERSQEGLDTLEILKSIDETLFVSVLSAYPNRYRDMAMRLDANVFQSKSARIEEDMESIINSLDPDRVALYHLAEDNPSLLEFINKALHNGFFTSQQILSGLKDFKHPGIVDSHGRPLDKNSIEHKTIVIDVTNTNREIIKFLKRNPELIRTLSPREFEEMIAELLLKQGYEVTLTPATKDGGFDMYAAKQEALGTFLYLVECKHYTPPNKVGVEIVRSLYGVVQQEKATAGVVVTSSSFTSGAKDFQRKAKHHMHLHDYIEIQRWLKIVE